MKQETEREAIYAEERRGTWDSTTGSDATIDSTADSKDINKKEDIYKGKRKERK